MRGVVHEIISTVARLVLLDANANFCQGERPLPNMVYLNTWFNSTFWSSFFVPFESLSPGILWKKRNIPHETKCFFD